MRRVVRARIDVKRLLVLVIITGNVTAPGGSVSPEPVSICDNASFSNVPRKFHLPVFLA